MRPNLFPFSLYTPTARILVVLSLHKGADGLFYVNRQEDFYEPQVLPGLIIPGGYTVLTAIKLLIGVNCLILAWFVQTFLGYWRPSKKGIKGGKVAHAAR